MEDTQFSYLRGASLEKTIHLLIYAFRIHPSTFIVYIVRSACTKHTRLYHQIFSIVFSHHYDIVFKHCLNDCIILHVLTYILIIPLLACISEFPLI